MRFETATLLAVLFLIGCVSPPREKPPASFQPIDIREGIYLARLEIHTTITADGLLRSVRTENKTYSPADVGPNANRVEIRSGRLSSTQMDQISRDFAGFENDSTVPYTGVPDGGEIQISRGGRTVTGGAIPKPLSDAIGRIHAITAHMPVTTN